MRIEIDGASALLTGSTWEPSGGAFQGSRVLRDRVSGDGGNDFVGRLPGLEDARRTMVAVKMVGPRRP